MSLRLALPCVLAAFVAGCNCAAPGVTCTDRMDCVNPAKPYCATALGACVQCLADEMCPDGFVCNGQGECAPGCRTEQGRCELGHYCLAATGCVECTTDTQCGDGRVCSANACVPGCSAQHPTCPSGLVCDATAGKCVGCLNNSQCTTPPLNLCDPQSQTCVECVANADCPSTKPVCDGNHTCVQCTADTQCAAGSVCQNSTCVPGCTPAHPCPGSQQCTQGQCVQCMTDMDCSGATPRCDPASHTCKECLPGASDNCPPGSYCRNDFVCERGCKNGPDCPSGTCLPDHSCSGCTMDSQCAAGRVCQNGNCVAACSGRNPCGTGLSCCTGHCSNLENDALNCGACGNACGSNQGCCGTQCADFQNDPNNCGRCGNVCGSGSACCAGQCKPLNSLADCGQCGNTCAANEFCDGMTCRSQTFPEFCANANVYAIRDNIVLDQAATNVLASTIQQYCPMTTIQYGSQTNASWVDQTTGALLLGGGSTVVTAGGPFPNKVVKWLERTNLVTKVYFDSNNIDTFYFRRRADNSVLVTRLQSWCNPNRDVFVLELATDPTSSTLALITYGLCSPGNGTQAGAWYWANVLLPNRNAYTDSWYLVEWGDTDLDQQPDMGEFTILSSGR